MGRGNTPPKRYIASAAKQLLHRPALRTPVLTKECAPSLSLVDWIALLSDKYRLPDEKLTGPLLCRFAADFMLAYLHPKFIHQAASEQECRLTFEQFVHRRHGTASLEGKDELRDRLLRLGFALCMVADLPRTAHILQDIITRRLDPAFFNEIFQGLDIGSGTGILSLAMAACAGRNEFAEIKITAFERDEAVAWQTEKVFKALRIGRVVTGDAKAPTMYRQLDNAPIAFVCNETLPSQGHRLWKEDFIPISRTLLRIKGNALRRAAFFPMALAATARQDDGLVEFGTDNQFTTNSEYPMRLMKAWGIRLQDGLWPLERIGEPMRGCVSANWLPLLGRRW
jgi:hypothetical protein